MCTRSSAYIQAHSLALRWMPGTAAESGLRVKSCIALPSTDFMPIQPTQVYQKGDQISAVSSSLWTLSLSIPLGKSALLFCVSSYHNADSVSPLICNMFCFLCKKKKKKRNVLLFYPVKVPMLSIACFLIFTVLYCYSFLQNGANCWLSSCFLTALHTDHPLLHFATRPVWKHGSHEFHKLLPLGGR